MMRSKTNLAIEVQDLLFSYRPRRRSSRSAEVLKGVSFTVDRGEISWLPWTQRVRQDDPIPNPKHTTP